MLELSAGQIAIGRERIAGRAARNRVRRAVIDVEPQHVAEQVLRVLRVALRVAARAAVAEADVEKAVGAERDVASVVVRVWLIKAQDVLPARERERRAVIGRREAREP